jgi:hypothetical protein
MKKKFICASTQECNKNVKMACNVHSNKKTRVIMLRLGNGNGKDVKNRHQTQH